MTAYDSSSPVPCKLHSLQHLKQRALPRGQVMSHRPYPCGFGNRLSVLGVVFSSMLEKDVQLRKKNGGQTSNSALTYILGNS